MQLLKIYFVHGIEFNVKKVKTYFLFQDGLIIYLVMLISSGSPIKRNQDRNMSVRDLLGKILLRDKKEKA